MIRLFFCFLFTLLSNFVFSQQFEKVIQLIDSKNFFKANEVYLKEKGNCSSQQRKIIEAFLENAFNDPKTSNEKINLLLTHPNGISDSLSLKLYRLKEDNLVKLYQYKDAQKTLEAILEKYPSLLSESEEKDIRNNLRIWTALQNVPPQQVHISTTYRVKMMVDKAGLRNLPLTDSKNNSMNFIFDTGANISTILKSTALRLGMKIIPAEIEVGTITGQTIKAQLASCPTLYLGTIEINNAIFLVFPDDALYFPEMDYRINGIIGFPIIEALKEVQITRDGYFIVPQKETTVTSTSNMALDSLIPLIYIDGKHYTFDTGADKTILYHSFYLANKAHIDSTYPLQKIHFGGAGGKKEFEGFLINQEFAIFDKTIMLESVQLLKEKVKEEETVYGNIGQDLIQKFHTMTLNFDKMFIKFE